MGIFGDDKLQDQRIAALERHVRGLTETAQASQVDLAAAWIAILSLQAQVDEKVSSADVDPAITELNTKLAAAREELKKSSAAASESWATLQGGVRESFETLRTSVNQASQRLKKG
jgi:chromosome segregation ATPase